MTERTITPESESIEEETMIDQEWERITLTWNELDYLDAFHFLNIQENGNVLLPSV